MTLTMSATTAVERPGDKRFRCEVCGRFTPELRWVCESRKECDDKIKELARGAR